MKIEILVLLVTGFFVANTYYDGKYIEVLKSWKKYYQMCGIAFAGLSAYLFFKKHPSESRNLIASANGVINKLPIDKSTADIFTPFLKLAQKQQKLQQHPQPIYNQQNNMLHKQNTINKTKRSVSETKKKYVASQQNWCCGQCKNQLTAWFEVDHTIRLENGGSNDVSNLVALCRNCHGEKTAMENL